MPVRTPPPRCQGLGAGGRPNLAVFNTHRLVAAIDNDLLPALSVLTYLPLSSNVSAVSAAGVAAVDAALIDLENRAMQAQVAQMFGACMAQMLGTDGTDVPHSAPLHRWHRCLIDHYPWP